MRHRALLLALSLVVVACSTDESGIFDGPAPPADAGFGGTFSVVDASLLAVDAAPPPPWPAPTGTDAGAAPTTDPPPDDAGEEPAQEASVAIDASAPSLADAGACARPLGPGDLVIDELMIASVAGAGDHGEWLE